MRMRRVGWAVDYLEEAQKLVRDPETHAGKWKELFDSRKTEAPETTQTEEILPESVPGRLHVEFGTGKGGYSLDMARLYPEEYFVAVEKNDSAAGIAASKYDAEGPENLRLIWNDARFMDTWFAPEEVDMIHLNFSDPWPKNRNAKRRLSADSFLRQYAAILKPDGKLAMKTDNAALFEYSLLQFSRAGWPLQEISVDFRRSEHPEDAMTEYERKFTTEGKPIYRAVWRRK
ncbi:tRNA (guanosine(46)-N7)-methyltransferase TrmB [uncultured Faecalibaculum sp.]|uniref:tRNA (guanosine(46)-N7)-methyltransferase TrmB n=2 Tax=uncultured Faecalibaculum sp. TaxID=1729681 RepID=UPI0025DA1053|nr:tRNA (guanosine(46)-N7)-methyltransferase TrmB [uncultured Faecalibaculum sp.]